MKKIGYIIGLVIGIPIFIFVVIPESEAIYDELRGK